MSSIISIPEDLKKEFRVNEKGETSCSIRGSARIFLVHHSQLSRHLSGEQNSSKLYQTLIEQGFDTKNMVSWTVEGIPIEAVIVIAQYYLYTAKQTSNQTKEKAHNFLNAIIESCKKDENNNNAFLKYLTIDKSIRSTKKSSKSAQKSPEYKIQQQFIKSYGGLVEVPTPVGRIDILTDHHLVEIKNANSWKSAVGQLLMYGHYYPNHQKVMYLFELSKHTDLDLIKYHCQDFFIDVVTESDLDDYLLKSLLDVEQVM